MRLTTLRTKGGIGRMTDKTGSRPSMAAAFGALALAGMGLAGCASAPKVLPPEPGPVTSSNSTPSQTLATGPAPGSAADFVAVMNGRDTIYFDTDKYNIDEADAAALRLQANWLQHYPAKRATVEGHADERGTRDYNIALGQRRATAAKDYLAGLGVDPARISTISYGKERPVALGSNEEAWAKNRRAVTVTID